MARKRLISVFQKVSLNWKDPCLVFSLSKPTKITRGLTIDVSKSAPIFMPPKDFLNVENIGVFTLFLLIYVVLLNIPLVFRP